MPLHPSASSALSTAFLPPQARTPSTRALSLLQPCCLGALSPSACCLLPRSASPLLPPSLLRSLFLAAWVSRLPSGRSSPRSRSASVLSSAHLACAPASPPTLEAFRLSPNIPLSRLSPARIIHPPPHCVASRTRLPSPPRLPRSLYHLPLTGAPAPGRRPRPRAAPGSAAAAAAAP
jgi:hypothetical protein